MPRRPPGHTEVCEVSQWDIRGIPDSATFIVIGAPGSGKSTFMENVAFYNRDRLPVGRVCVGTETGYARMQKIFPPLFVSDRYDGAEHHEQTNRQRQCIRENGGGYLGNSSFTMFDDVGTRSDYNSDDIRNMFKRGSQHWAQVAMLGTQYAIDFPPDVRKSVTYVVLFNEPNEQDRKKLYTNFGGLAGSYDDFCDLMDTICEPYTCIVIKLQRPSPNRSENIFWFKTEALPLWKFGCKEYRAWGRERNNPDFIGELD
jgi:hypothetical protein